MDAACQSARTAPCAAGRTHEFAYDATGNMVDAIDPLGNHTRFSYAGPQHRLTFLLDAKGNPTRYAHDD